MLDKNFIVQNPQVVKTALTNRGKDQTLVDKVVEIDQGRKNILLQVEEQRAAQNKISRELKGKPTPEQLAAATGLKDTLKKLEEQLKFTQSELDAVMEEIPNLPADDVPVGKDDNDNVVIKTVGEIRKFDFQPLDHVDLGLKLDIIDIEKSAQVSGARFGYFKNQAAILEKAIHWYVFKKVVDKGFIPLIPPYMVKGSTEWKMGYVSNKNLEGAHYYMKEDDLDFVTSSEHSVGPYHMDELLDNKKLPLKYVAFSPCFRRESGTYGKDMKGLLRVHCFNKVEMVCFTTPDFAVSDAMCKEMLAIEEEVLQDLELPYQVVSCCTGDLPHPNRRMYDINTYFAGQGKYRETHSCSNCTDYQARRLNTKTRVDGENKFVHMLNATVASDRPLLAMLEYHQQADGSIQVPKALQSLVGFATIQRG